MTDTVDLIDLNTPDPGAIERPRSARLADLLDGPNPHEIAAAAWLAGYSNKATVEGYKLSIRRWFQWCDNNNINPLRVVRAHIEMWQRSLENDGLAPRSIAGRLSATANFYRYLVDEEMLDRDPMRGVKRPRIERKSPTAWLSRPQLADLITASQELGVHQHALICLLGLNGLRIAEACSLDVESLTWDGFYPVLTFIRKGGGLGSAALSRPTEAAIRTAIGDRKTGPILLTRNGTRMTRESAQRIINNCLPAVRGEHGRITPHALRHSWTTACVDANIPTEQVQHDGGWDDPRMIGYYTHGQAKPARAATHAVSAFVYGAG